MGVSHQLNKRQILEEVALSLSVYVIYLVPSTVLQKKKKVSVAALKYWMEENGRG